MPVEITYFVHGTTTDNEKGISSGWHDVGLSELGVKQSKELKEQIEGKKFDVVFCSDLKRAVDSTKLAFEGVAPIIPDKRLRECFRRQCLVTDNFKVSLQSQKFSSLIQCAHKMRE